MRKTKKMYKVRQLVIYKLSEVSNSSIYKLPEDLKNDITKLMALVDEPITVSKNDKYYNDVLSDLNIVIDTINEDNVANCEVVIRSIVEFIMNPVFKYNSHYSNQEIIDVQTNVSRIGNQHLKIEEKIDELVDINDNIEVEIKSLKNELKSEGLSYSKKAPLINKIEMLKSTFKNNYTQILNLSNKLSSSTEVLEKVRNRYNDLSVSDINSKEFVKIYDTAETKNIKSIEKTRKEQSKINKKANKFNKKRNDNLNSVKSRIEEKGINYEIEELLK